MQKTTVHSNPAVMGMNKSNPIVQPYQLTRMQRLYLPFKRLMDMLFSAVMLVLFTPVFLIVFILIKRENKKSVIFRQQRVGKNGRLFYIYKFRTMKDTTPANKATSELENARNHITKIGKFLRNTSLDETPQFFNVLKGDMALIGARPLVPSETQTHTLRRQRGIYATRPGLTGLAQINGRDLVSPEEKVAYDEQYLHRFGFFTDMGIFLRSILAVLSRKGIAEGSQADKPPHPNLRMVVSHPIEPTADDIEDSYPLEEAGS